uniref:Uncharacterized protein n=1 Tax=Arundo donax TaxID=35708 RepID=A0A0A8YZZ7_ARUDO
MSLTTQYKALSNILTNQNYSIERKIPSFQSRRKGFIDDFYFNLIDSKRV